MPNFLKVFFIFLFSSLFLFLLASSVYQPGHILAQDQTTISINPEISYQTMEGWGFSLPGVASMNFGANPLCCFPFQPGEDDIFYQLLFDSDQGLGVTHLTFYQHWSLEGFWNGYRALTYEEVNDNADPMTINWAGFDLSPDWPNWQVLQKAAPYGVQFKLQIGTTPAWMKSGTKLAPSQRDEYAEYLAVFLLYARDTLNIDIPYLTIQNEPNGGGGLYDPTELAATLNAVARMLNNKGLSTQLVAPETSIVSGGVNYAQQFINDSVVRNRLAAISVHPYGSDTTSTWRNLATFGQQNNLPIWQGEWSTVPTTGGRNLNMADALRLSQDMLRQITEGNVSVWYNFLGLGSTTGSDGGSEGALIIFTPQTGSNFTYTLPPRYYAFGQFSKYIRPGDVRIQANSGTNAVKVTAFRKPSGDLTVVLINTSTSNQPVSVNGWGNLSQVSQTRTSATENGQSQGNLPIVSGRVALNLPAKSITTLTSCTGSQCSQTPTPTPTPTPTTSLPTCRYDYTADGQIEVNDLLNILENWGKLDPYNHIFGVNQLLRVLLNWGKCS